MASPALAGRPAIGSVIAAVPDGQSSVPIAQVLPIVIVLYSFLLFPPELNLSIAGVALPPYRLAILPFSIFLALSIVGQRLRFCFPDALVLGACSWTLIAFTHHYDIATGLVRGLGIVVDTAGPYFIARSCVRSVRDFRIVLILVAPGLLFAGLQLLVESLTHTVLLRQVAADIFGPLVTYDNGEAAGSFQLTSEVRMGLTRAYGPFSHPILGGVLLASVLSLYAVSGIRSWPRAMGVIAALLGFFSLSSAAVMCLMVGGGLVIIDKIIRPVKGVSWWLVTSFLILGAVLIEAVSKGGLVNVLIRLTLNPQTGYYRKAIWEYGLASISRNPLYGIGFQSFERADWMGSASIDAHFLAQGVRDGVVTPILMLAAFLYTIIWLGRKIALAPKEDRNAMFSVNVTLVALVLSGMTVAYFSESQIWFITILGIAVSLAKFANKSSVSGGCPARSVFDKDESD